MNKANPALVGAFMLSGMALAVGAILIFGGTEFFSPRMRAVVYFRGSVGGLDIGAPVTFRGVTVGSVSHIAVTLDMTDFTARIPVDLNLDPSKIALENDGMPNAGLVLDRLLAAGLRAQLTMQSLITGQLRVDLDLHPGPRPAATPGGAAPPGVAEIPSMPSQLQTLEDEIAALPLKDIAQNARDTLAATRKIAEALAPRAGKLADNFQKTADAAQATLARIDILTATGNRQIAMNGAALHKLLASSDKTARDADALVAALQENIGAHSELNANLQAAIRDLAASASALRGFSHEIERDPSAILSGRTAH
jgi:paraquat-inducible protein B